MCFLLGGCLTRPPIIAVDSVEIVERNETAMALHYNLVLTNPNDKPIEPLEFTYSVSVAGRGVYSGRHAAEMTLDAGGQKRPLALPAVIPYDRVGWIGIKRFPIRHAGRCRARWSTWMKASSPRRCSISDTGLRQASPPRGSDDHHDTSATRATRTTGLVCSIVLAG